MENNKTSRRVEFALSGLHPALFLTDVDEYFICRICYFVVRTPLACTACENLYCKECAEKYIRIRGKICKYCKAELNLLELRKFPLKIYSQFTLFCENYNHGCRFEGSIEEIRAHIQECEFSLIHCSNPLCTKEFLLKDCTFLDLRVCSLKCNEAVQFWNILGKQNKIDYIKFFWQCLDAYKTKLQNSIEEESKDLAETGDEKLKQIQEETEKLRQQLYEVKHLIHNGKLVHSVWTCCKQEKYSQGCVKI
ncbi:unnamed protein product [Blepharisma stoltei]|uniref:RING-type domain-containing protein n=1 Tax=Blepharisma stoltei TaxID=1481888 RepID=A0AAU9IIA6_9CILI|nr:unnamed protein product [Blepharisma stoltei]